LETAAFDPAVTHIERYRIFNRALTAVGYVVMVLILRRIRPHVPSSLRVDPTDRDMENGQLFFEATEGLMRGSLMAGAALATICTLIGDLRSPGQYNPAILYVVPMALLGMIGRRWVTISAAIALIGLAYVGYLLGPPALGDPSLTAKFITNRTLAGLAIAAVAWLSLVITFKPPREQSG
jgi:hypothetical protein